MSFYSVHLAWQQRVAHETRDHSHNFKRVLSGKTINKNENSLNGMYGYLFNAAPATQQTYQAKHATQRQTDMLSQRSTARSAQRANLKTAIEHNRTQTSANPMKTFLPDDYFKRVGYQALPDDYSLCSQSKNGIVTGQIRVDALGQRVRERFNEDINYEDKLSTTSKQLRLKNRLIDDNKSNASSAFRVRSIQSSHKARAMSVASGQQRGVNNNSINFAHQNNEHLSLGEAQTLIKKVLGEDEEYQQADPVEVDDEQITVSALEDQESEVQDDAVSRPSCQASTTASTRNYLNKLERALKEERERRNQLEQEVQEVHKINKEITQKMN